MKRCSKCGEQKPRSEYYRHGGTRDGLKTFCKACGRVASGVYYRDHAGEQNAKSSAKYSADPSKKADYDRRYRARHRMRLAALKQVWAAQRRAAGLRRVLSADQRAATQRRDASRYLVNRQRIGMRTAQYRGANLNKHVAWTENWRGRHASGAGVTASQWLALRSVFGERCLACGTTARLTMDHVRPLSCAGEHDVSNVQLLCRSCNKRKGERSDDYRPSDWRERFAERMHVAA